MSLKWSSPPLEPPGDARVIEAGPKTLNGNPSIWSDLLGGPDVIKVSGLGEIGRVPSHLDNGSFG